MKFTKKQFDEIGPWHFSDLCFKSKSQKQMLKIFNLLPSNLQGLAVSWGCNDSVFRNDVFEFLVKNQFGMTVKQYYESDIFNWFIKKDKYQKFSFEKLESKKVQYDIETGGMFMYDEGVGHKITMDGKAMIIGFQEALKANLSTGGFGKGELGFIFAPHGIGKSNMTKKVFDASKGRYDEKIEDLINKHKKDA